MPTERDIGSDSPRNKVFTPPYFKAEAVREVFKSSRQLQVLLGKNHILFVVETYHTFTFSSFVRPSRCRRLHACPNQPRKSCQDRMSHAFVLLLVALADALLMVDPGAIDSFLKKFLLLSSFFSFSRFLFFSSFSWMFFSFSSCSFNFAFFVRKFISHVQSKSLCVTMAIEQPTL